MHMLITAGPTREPIDDVRFISNRSSGRMGVALAEAAAAAGHRVTLLLGPVPEPAALPETITVLRFETAAQLQALLESHFADSRILIMAAAVCDYRPAAGHPGKLKRSAENLTLQFEPTPDLVAVLAQAKRPRQRIVAFALDEPDQLETQAAEKLKRKNVDAIVANPLATMESDRIEPIWLTAAGDRHAPGPMEKIEFARWLVSRLEDL